MTRRSMDSGEHTHPLLIGIFTTTTPIWFSPPACVPSPCQPRIDPGRSPPLLVNLVNDSRVRPLAVRCFAALSPQQNPYHKIKSVVKPPFESTPPRSSLSLHSATCHILRAMPPDSTHTALLPRLRCASPNSVPAGPSSQHPPPSNLLLAASF